MSKQNKLYLIVLGVIIFLIGLIPWIDGFLFKRNYLNFLTVLNASNSLKVNLLEYNQGWLSSSAKVSVTFFGFPVGITVDQEIEHGPFVRDLITQERTASLATIQSSVNTQQMTAQIDTRVTLGGTMLDQIQVSPITLQFPGVGKITWQGLQGSGSSEVSSRQIMHAKSETNIGSLLVEVSSAALAIDPFFIRNDISYSSTGMWSGDYEVSMPSVAIKNTSGITSMMGSRWVVSSQPGSEGENIVVQLSMSRLMAPAFSASPVTFKVVANNLNTPGVIQFKKAVFASQPGKKIMFEQYAALLSGLIKETTLLNGESVINSSYGPLVLNSKISWPATAFPLLDLNAIMNKADIDFNVRVSVALVNYFIEMTARNQAPHRMQAMADAISNSMPETFDDEVNRISQHNEITIDVVIQLKNLQDKNLSIEKYNQEIDGFVKRKQMSAAIGAELKNYHEAHFNQNTQQAAPPQMLSIADLQVKIVQEMQQNIAALIAQGYLVQDKNDYVINMMRKEGTIKVNSKEMTEEQFKNAIMLQP